MSYDIQNFFLPTGCIWLCGHFTQERIQHLDRVHVVPIHLRRHCCPAIQRTFLVLYRRVQIDTRGVPVSVSVLSLTYSVSSYANFSQLILSLLMQTLHSSLQGRILRVFTGIEGKSAGSSQTNMGTKSISLWQCHGCNADTVYCPNRRRMAIVSTNQ